MGSGGQHAGSEPYGERRSLASAERGAGRPSLSAQAAAGQVRRCAYCSTFIKPGQVTSKGRKQRVYHLACFYEMQAKNSSSQSQRDAERAEQQARADAVARESMRAQKPNDWRLGKSPSDYGRH